MVRGLTQAGIAATHIGEITPAPERIVVHATGREERIETLGRDELYRVIEEMTRAS